MEWTNKESFWKRTPQHTQVFIKKVGCLFPNDRFSGDLAMIGIEKKKTKKHPQSKKHCIIYRYDIQSLGWKNMKTLRVWDWLNYKVKPRLFTFPRNPESSHILRPWWSEIHPEVTSRKKNGLQSAMVEKKQNDKWISWKGGANQSSILFAPFCWGDVKKKSQDHSF